MQWAAGGIMSSTCPSVCACVRAYMHACFYSMRRHSPTGLPSASYVQFIFSLVTSSTCKPVINRPRKRNKQSVFSKWLTTGRTGPAEVWCLSFVLFCFVDSQNTAQRAVSHNASRGGHLYLAQKFEEGPTCRSGDMFADRQTNRYITILRFNTGSGVRTVLSGETFVNCMILKFLKGVLWISKFITGDKTTP